MLLAGSLEAEEIRFQATGYRHCNGCIIPQVVTQSLVLLKMGKKHVELIGIINKPLLLHPVSCLYYLYQWCTVKQISYVRIYIIKFCNKHILIENFNYNKLSRVISKGHLLRKIHANDIPKAELFPNCCIVTVVRGPMFSPTHISELWAFGLTYLLTYLPTYLQGCW